MTRQYFWAVGPNVIKSASERYVLRVLGLTEAQWQGMSWTRHTTAAAARAAVRRGES